MKDFIIEWRAAQAKLNRLASYAESKAPDIIFRLTKEQPQVMSLRQLARRLNRSPTYLSQVANGHTSISVDAFCDLLKIMEEHAG